MFTLTVLTATLTLGQASAPEPAPVTPVQARQAIERSLVFLEKEGVAWKNDRKCVSCHHVPFMLWTHHEARERGFAVDAKKMDEVTQWALDAKNFTPGGTGANPVAWLLLGKPAANAEKEDWIKAIDLVLKHQNPNGSWDPPGQFNTQKRPAKERVEVVAGWAVLALGYGEKKEDRTAQGRERALELLKTAQAGVSTESLVLRALIEHRFGDAKAAEARLQELLAQQNADGGWNWFRDGKTSDAFATGQVLDVLGSAGVDASSPAIQRARAYLLQTQQEDGSWSVKSGPISDGKPAKIAERDMIYGYWGTAWATLGLLRTTPKP